MVGPLIQLTPGISGRTLLPRSSLPADLIYLV